MKIVLQILVTMFLMYWPIAMMFSVMAFDAPGSENKLAPTLLALTICFSPLVFGLAFYFFDASFWGLAPKRFLIATFVVPLLASFLFGYPRLLKNNLFGISSTDYFVKDDQVYHNGRAIKADAKTFIVVGLPRESMAKDKDHVYYQDKVIKGADPKSFRPVAESESSYYQDNQHVFKKFHLILEADSATFEKIKREDGSGSHYRDKNYVFYDGKVLKGANPKSARYVGINFLVDHEKVFYINEAIPGADAASFQSFSGESYGKDKNRVYYEVQALSGSDPTSFVVLDRGYSKDAEKVFYYGQLVEGADANSFSVMQYDSKTESEAKDKNRLYMEGKAK